MIVIFLITTNNKINTYLDNTSFAIRAERMIKSLYLGELAIKQ